MYMLWITVCADEHTFPAHSSDLAHQCLMSYRSKKQRPDGCHHLKPFEAHSIYTMAWMCLRRTIPAIDDSKAIHDYPASIPPQISVPAITDTWSNLASQEPSEHGAHMS